MTQLLEQAYSRVSQLPGNEQDAIAAIILEALEDDQWWATSFAESQDVLAKLAEEAMAEYRAGDTLPLEPETL
jgi:hypothetical protein